MEIKKRATTTMSTPRYIKRSIKRSTYEDKIVEDLKEHGVTFGYETEAFPYIVEHKYIPDFVFYNTRILVEAKGYFTGADRSKILRSMPAIRDEGWDLRFVFMRASNKLNKNSKTTYGDWCDKHGFIWTEGMIPKEWYS